MSGDRERIEAAARAWAGVPRQEEWQRLVTLGETRGYIAGATEEAARYARLVEAASYFVARRQQHFRESGEAALDGAFSALRAALADLQVKQG